MTGKKKRVSDYKQDPLNHNVGSEFGNGLLEKSIQKNGLVRSIVVSSDDVIIAGNKTQAKAGELGLEKVIEVETDGNTLVVVKRKDIRSGTKQFYDAALADNLVQKHNFVEDANVTEAIAEAYDVKPYDWAAQDTTQLHNENRGKGLAEFNLGEDDEEADDDVPPAKNERTETLYPISATVNRGHFAKWEKFKQLQGIKKDSDAMAKIIDKLDTIEWE